jgi:large subunit ribosomal protein L4
VVRENAAARRGTHATKNRAPSAAAARSLASEGDGPRAGRIAADPAWRHGGTVFGPQPRSYAYDLPKKAERGALRSAFAQKMRTRRSSWSIS